MGYVQFLDVNYFWVVFCFFLFLFSLLPAQCAKTKKNPINSLSGPNLVYNTLITRIKQDHNQAPMIRGGKHMLEFVAYKRKFDDKWAIPGSMGAEQIQEVLDRMFPEEFDRTRREVYKYVKEAGREHNMVCFACVLCVCVCVCVFRAVCVCVCVCVCV